MSDKITAASMRGELEALNVTLNLMDSAAPFAKLVIAQNALAQARTLLAVMVYRILALEGEIEEMKKCQSRLLSTGT